MAIDGIKRKSRGNPHLDLRATKREVKPRRSSPPTPPPQPLLSQFNRPEEVVLQKAQAKPRRHWRWKLVGLATAPLIMIATTVAMSVSEGHAPELKAITAAETKKEEPVTKPVPQPDAVLQAKLNTLAATIGAPAGVVVKKLDSDIPAAQINATSVFTSASLYKLFVAKQIYERADIGTLSLTAPSGVSGLNIEQCLKIMIDVSNNPCGIALGNKLGWGKQNAALAAEGYVGTNLYSLQKTTAADVALLLERLYKGELLEPTTTQLFMTHLKQQRVNNRLPVGLPAGTVIAHKTGDLYGYLHDAGIVYGPSGNYLIVMTSGPWKSDTIAFAKFAELSRLVYAHYNP